MPPHAQASCAHGGGAGSEAAEHPSHSTPLSRGCQRNGSLQRSHPRRTERRRVTPERKFKRAAARYRAAEHRLSEAREELHTAMVEARAAGMTLDAMASVLGVSRQRVYRIIRGE